MAWLRLAGSLQLHVSIAKEPYKRADILQKRPIILRSLLIVATPSLYGGKVAGLIWIRCAAEALRLSFAKSSRPTQDL